MEKMTDIQNDFFKKVAEDDLEKVQELVCQGVDLYAKNEDDLTCLMIAAVHGSTKVLPFLIESGASLYQVSYNQDARFHCCNAEQIARHCHQAEAESILSSFQYNYQYQYRSYKSVALSCDADDLGHAIFSRYGNDINAQGGSDGETILITMAREGSFLKVKKLLELKADPNRRDKRLNTALHEASKNTRGSDSVSYFHLGPQQAKEMNDMNRYTIVKSLIEAGADVNAKNLFLDTPLHEFLNKNDQEIASFLIENGADVNAKDEHGTTPLYIVAVNGWIEMAQKLIEAGAKVDEPSFEGLTPLQGAYMYRQKEMMKLLLEKGAHPNKADAKGYLMVAQSVRNSDIALAEILIKAGADVSQKDVSGHSAFDWARYTRNERLKNMVIEASCQQEKEQQRLEEELFIAIENNDDAQVSRLINLGVDVLKKDENGLDAFNKAMIKGNLEMARMIQEAVKEGLLKRNVASQQVLMAQNFGRQNGI